MSRRRTTIRTAIFVAVLSLVLMTACSDSESGPEPSAAPSTLSSAAEPSPTPTAAEAAPVPRSRACYQYGYAAAIAPVARSAAVPCNRKHTAITFAVGDLDTVVDGHLVSVDSDRVQAQVAKACPRAFERFVGGSAEARRLTMLRPVWFTPSLRESDAGANWYRCDAVAIAADEKLAPLVGRLEGVLARPIAADQYAMCGTAEPGAPGFRRVICSAPHAWVALSTVDIAGRRYPGVGEVRAAGQEACQDAASAQADDPLNYRWGYEWPTAQQWQSGQHYGICWAPEPSSSE
jgi:putative regulator of septum formation